MDCSCGHDRQVAHDKYGCYACGCSAQREDVEQMQRQGDGAKGEEHVLDDHVVSSHGAEVPSNG